jgi:exosome complex component RRP43
VFNNPDVILSDPNDSEEQLANETVTVVMDTEGNLCKVYKNGGSSIGADAMRILFKRAKQRISELNSLINQVL